MTVQGFRGRTGPTRWNTAAAVIAALLLVYWTAALVRTRDRRFNPSLTPTADSGEAILHRIRPDIASPAAISFRLPFLSLSLAVLFTHRGGIFREAKNANGLILLALCCLLLAATYSLTAPILFALVLDKSALLDYTEVAFSLLVLLMAGVLLWRARKPNARKSLVLGLAIGVTLLFRSTLALFPPVLALYEWLFLYRRSLRLYWKHGLCLCVVPYLLLLPWVHMNWTLYRKVVPFEYSAVNLNAVTGAIGLVQTIEGDWRALISDRRLEVGAEDGVILWAIRQVRLHPFRYAAAYFARVVYVVSLNRMLLLLALFALWIHRDRTEFLQLGLLALYFIAIHCVMSVEANYFLPLWPLLAILAGNLIDRLRPRRELAISPSLYRHSRNLTGAGLLAVLAAALTVGLAVNSYARRAELEPATPERLLDGDIRLSPDDAWLRFERGRRRLRRGDVPAAAEDLSAGLALEPNVDADLKLAWAQMLLGRPRRLLYWRPPADTPPYSRENVSGPIYKAHGYSRMGQAAMARQELKTALDALRAQTYARGKTAVELDAVEELRRDSLVDDRLLMWLRILLARRPVKEKQDLLADLAALRPDSRAIFLERAALAERAGDEGSVRALLARARVLDAP